MAERAHPPQIKPHAVCLGVITAAHGVRGAMKVKTFTQSPLDLAAYGSLTDKSGERVFTVTSCRLDKVGVCITLEGVTTRDAAEALRGTEFYVARDRLPALGVEDEFYHADLVGLAAVTPDGEMLGRVAACHNFGAGDVLEIDGFFYPFTKQVVPEIDIAAGRLILVPPVENEAHPPEQISPKPAK